MAENDHINEESRKLAQEFGRYLEGAEPLKQIEDEFLELLQDYREELATEKVQPGKEEVWSNINKEIASRSTPIRLLQRSVAAKWAIAASILLLAAIGLYFSFFTAGEQLIREAGADIEHITLRDGSNVTLRPHSRLYKIDVNGSRMFYRMEGEAFFDIIKNDQRTFSVEAGKGKVTVLGTRFNMSNWGNRVNVYLEQGSVSFEHREKEDQVVLKPGEVAYLPDSTEAIMVKEDADPDVFMDWQKGKLTFRNERLITIAGELEQQFAIKIQVPIRFQNVRVSGELNLTSAGETLKFLAISLDGSFEKVSPRTFRYTENNSSN